MVGATGEEGGGGEEGRSERKAEVEDREERDAPAPKKLS